MTNEKTLGKLAMIPIIAGAVGLNGCGEKEKAGLFSNKEKKLECLCDQEFGGSLKSRLIGCYDIDKDGDLDCVYKQDSTQKIFLYENYRNGNAFRLAGEFHKKN